MTGFDLYKALKDNGFYEVNDEFGEVLRKDYEKETEVLWYGICKCYLVVRVRFNSDHTVAQVSYYDNKIPAMAFKAKTHLNDKRAYNAIQQTVGNKGFEL